MSNVVDLFGDFPSVKMNDVIDLDPVCETSCLMCGSLAKDASFVGRSELYSASLPPQQKRGRMDRSRMDQFTFVHQNRSIPVEDDIQLRYQSWRRTPNLGVVILVHDFSSHSDRLCRHLVPHFVCTGFSVVAYDQRNHGLSDSPILEYNWFDVKQTDAIEVLMEEHRNDLFAVIQTVSHEFPNIPVFLYGNGFGGTIVLDFGLATDSIRLSHFGIRAFASGSTILRTKDRLEERNVGVAERLDRGSDVSDSDNLRESMAEKQLTGIQMFIDRIGKALSFESVNQRWKVDPAERGLISKDLSMLSRDLRVEELVRRDEKRLLLVSDEVAGAMCSIIESVRGSATLWKQPLLLLHGNDDHFSSIEDVRRWKEASHSNVDLVEIEGARHWLHHEIQPARGQFLEKLSSHFLSRI